MLILKIKLHEISAEWGEIVICDCSVEKLLKIQAQKPIKKVEFYEKKIVINGQTAVLVQTEKKYLTYHSPMAFRI